MENSGRALDHLISLHNKQHKTALENRLCKENLAFTEFKNGKKNQCKQYFCMRQTMNKEV